MNQLRQMVARSEAEALIASEFARGGRPLLPNPGSSFLERDNMRFDHEFIEGDDIDPYPPATRRAFRAGRWPRHWLVSR